MQHAPTHVSAWKLIPQEQRIQYVILPSQLGETPKSPFQYVSIYLSFSKYLHQEVCPVVPHNIHYTKFNRCGGPTAAIGERGKPFNFRRTIWAGRERWILGSNDFVTIADLPVLDFVALLVRSPHLISSSSYIYACSFMAYVSLLPVISYDSYPRNVFRPVPSITIITAGISGLAAAACLARKGHSVRVLEL
jgi:hypothetical protein